MYQVSDSVMRHGREMYKVPVVEDVSMCTEMYSPEQACKRIHSRYKRSPFRHIHATRVSRDFDKL